MWKEIGKLGIGNDRKTPIPFEVEDADGTVHSDVKSVLHKWKTAYEKLYNEPLSGNFDEVHLENVKESLLNEDLGPVIDTDTTALNDYISREEVESSINRLKNNKAPG